MKRLTFAALALFATTAFTLRSGRRAQLAMPELATNGAYRDGLYLGRLAAKGSMPSHVATGRWSREDDRAKFSAGYQQAYNAATRDPEHK
jgi:hypothetical protein